jgi:hypothetical protein
MGSAAPTVVGTSKQCEVAWLEAPDSRSDRPNAGSDSLPPRGERGAIPAVVGGGAECQEADPPAMTSKPDWDSILTARAAGLPAEPASQ